ncbi:MAG: cobyric acid synthase [Acidimicrobiales bacterium]|jgi:adenosylcobyric acid synthase|nr:cobyric acid synthase [Acidimicrobiales bacterium]
MVCGTNSDAGKSTVVTGVCRLLARRGVKVAPFKAQNMALNSFVTGDGHEIGRAQGVQALAAGAEPDVTMNPILLKPTGERTSQVVVMGRPWKELDAAAYQEAKPELFDLVMDALTDLRGRFDVVICEGAGSPTEINLLGRDIVNLPLAQRAGLPAVVVGDIDRGGVFASLFGTVELLPPDLRAQVRAFVVNKLRGDPALLGQGPADLERRTGVPVIGVLPYLHDVALDAEDSLALDGRRPRPIGVADALADALDVAVIRFPRIANFTDLDALSIEPGVSVRYVSDAAGLGRPDLVVLPGTKATVADLEWLRGRNLDRAVAAAADAGALVLGICGGYQMLGRTIVDDVESARGVASGLGWLAVDTVFAPDKTTRQRRGHSMGQRVTGYEIHHGNVSRAGPDVGWVHLDDTYGVDDEGAVDTDMARFLGTSLHGLFESDGFRAAFLVEIGRRRDKTFVPAGVSFAAARQAQYDRLADSIEANVDIDRLTDLIAEGAPA